MTEEIEKIIIETSIKICKRGEGGMFIYGDELSDYSFLVNQDIKPFNIKDNPKTAESLALQDGAVWISESGELKGYGIMMTKLEPLMNKGTRHASALAASKHNGNKVFLISQEDKKIKIFQEGENIMQVDVYENGIEKSSTDIVKIIERPTNVFESLGAGTAATILAGLALPSMGITLLPGILIFGGTHFVAKKLLKK